jgi:hypothetical protein
MTGELGRRKGRDMNTSSLNGIIQTLVDGEMTIAEAAQHFEVAEIIERYGQWVVTSFGLECLVTSYAIRASMLGRTDWSAAMADKRWVNDEEFAAALAAARQYHQVDRDPVQIVLPPPPAGTKRQPYIDRYIASKFVASLQSLHQVYHAIETYVPADLRGPQAAPASFSEKEDGLLGPVHIAFAYEMDGLLGALDCLYLLKGGQLYQELLAYSYKQFEMWLAQMTRDL